MQVLPRYHHHRRLSHFALSFFFPDYVASLEAPILLDSLFEFGSPMRRLHLQRVRVA